MTPNNPTLEGTIYSLDGFTTVNDIRNVSETLLNDISRSFKNQGRFKNVLKEGTSFGGRRFYNYGEDIFMFEYSSLKELQQDSDEWSKYFNKKNDFTSETIDGNQVLESSGNFEYQGKYYLLGVLYRDMNGDDNNEDRGIYKGVIINPSRYLQTEDILSHVSQKVKGALK